MKKVIFVGGNSFSGTTFLEMILANDPNGFSCGEVQALFRPYKLRHVNPECSCGDKSCTIWKEILQNGEKNLYQTIFNLFPRIDFILDSSKNPFWLSLQSKLLKKQDILSKNILVWKSPLDSAHSYNKRNNLKKWEKSWIGYHRLYFTEVQNWKSVRYDDLTNNTTLIKKVCHYLEIPYFEGKEQFWKKKTHTLFGNSSAKIHLYPKNSGKFQQTKNSIVHSCNEKETSIIKNHQSIYYNIINDKYLEDYVYERMEKNKYFTTIISILNNNDTTLSESNLKDIEKIKINWMLLHIKKIKRFIFQNKKINFLLKK